MKNTWGKLKGEGIRHHGLAEVFTGGPFYGPNRERAKDYKELKPYSSVKGNRGLGIDPIEQRYGIRKKDNTMKH